jgi:hypothetical protein
MDEMLRERIGLRFMEEGVVEGMDSLGDRG